ncbi:bifunctional DNA primase/polymerase [Nocardioides sp. NPDC004968]|uniref:bifunctional DNA primase/polymerase n=1 Tax=Nocardioides sp. NPDC004968 TaxID=3155894 RepID=UPI00339DD1C7
MSAETIGPETSPGTGSGTGLVTGAELVSAALWYAGQGLPVFPCEVGGKRPLTRHGWRDATTDADQIRAWWMHTPEANIGLPTGGRFDVIDLDGFDAQRTLKGLALAEEIDAALYWTVSTPREGGMHLYVPASGASNAAGIGGRGLDYRGRGGYVIAPPSRTDAGRYTRAAAAPTWPETDALPGDVPNWLDRLKRELGPERIDRLEPGKPPAEGWVEWINAQVEKHPYTRELEQQADQPPELTTRTEPDRDLTVYAACAVAGELAKLDALARPWHEGARWDSTTFEVACNLIELANAPWSGYTLGDAQRDLAARAPTDEVWRERDVYRKWDSAWATVGGKARPEPEALRPVVAEVSAAELSPEPAHACPALSGVGPDSGHDDADFWDARKSLRRVHDWARAREAAPLAVLGVVLARVVAATPANVVLPPIIGGEVSLNLFLALVAPSGGGKGAADRAAGAAVNLAPAIESGAGQDFRETGPGSGEGIAHLFVRRDRKGDVHQHTRAALLNAPEVDTLNGLKGRQGSTLMPELRKAWMGEPLGFAYADPAKRLPVDRHEYRLCAVVGVQPSRAGTLLDDASGGTPQRFLWLPTTDRNIPDETPPEPAALTWEAPVWPALVDRLRTLEVCAEAEDVIRSAHKARQRGHGDALDGHALLCREKVAAALAILDGHAGVRPDDWHLAGRLMEISDRTRAGVVAALQADQRRATVARAKAEGLREIERGKVVAEDGHQRAGRAIVRKLRSTDEWAAASDVRRALKHETRPHFESALEALSETGQVEISDPESGRRGRRIRLAESVRR